MTDQATPSKDPDHKPLQQEAHQADESGPSAAPLERPTLHPRSGAATAQQMLHLQSRVGNQSAQRMLQRSPQGKTLQRQDHPPAAPAEGPGHVITINPVVIAGSRTAELQAQSDQMMARFPEIWRGFCRDWYDASLNALSTVSEPENPYEARNFWIALGGNMLWAATSITLFASGAGIGIAAIGASVAGAGAGSGVFATPAPASGRDNVGQMLASQRDRIERNGTRTLYADVASRAIGNSATQSDTEAQDRLLWGSFASGIDFDNRASVMLVNARTRLASWYQQFRTQYLAWKAREDVIAKAREYELGEIANEPFGSPIDLAADILGIGTPGDSYFQQAMQDIPFNPVLR